MTPPPPPRAIERLLEILLPAGPSTDAALGDLAERYARHAGSRSAARFWYCREALSLAAHSLLRRGDRRGQSGPAITETLFYDLSFAVRIWRRRPALAAVMVVALAIGIGATTAMFSVLRAVVLRPLPYADPERLSLIWSATADSPNARGALSPPDVVAMRQSLRLFADVAAVNSFGASFTDGIEPEQIQLGVVTANFFDVIGVRPLLGRAFDAADDTPMDTRDARNTSVVIISHGLWTRRFGAAPAVLGRTVRLGGTPMVIIGVLPETFRLHMPSGAGMSTDLAAWTPLRIDYANAPRAGAFLKVIGRLRPETTREAAQQELDLLSARFRSELGAHDAAGLRLRAAPIHAEAVGHVTPILSALSATVGLLLIIACANVANLLLVRLAARERELAVRAALGGSRSRVIRQLLTECGVIGILAAIAGTLVAWAIVQVLVSSQPANVPRVDTVAIDAPVLAFTTIVAVICTTLFGLAPAILSSRADVASTLRDRTGGAAVRSRRLRDTFVALEVGLCLVVLVAAGLMMRSVAVLRVAELGFRPENVLTFRLSLPFSSYRSPAQWTELYRALTERLENLPGVEAVGTSSTLPASGDVSLEPFGLAPGAETKTWGARTAAHRTVDPDYFTALRIPLRAGRAFESTDGASTPLVAVVDEALARATWPKAPAVGQRIEVSLELFDRGYRVERRVAEVVGVVATVAHGRPDAAAPGTIYLAHAQQPLWGMAVAVRTNGNPLAILAAVREQVRALDASLPVFDVRTLSDVVATTLATTRFILMMTAMFAAIAMILASAGLYAVIVYAVRQRTREFGVRLALGAAPARIARGVLLDAMRVAAAGIVIGVLTAPFVARALEGVLVGVTPNDPATIAAATVLVMALVVLASGLPARLAASVSPAEALRAD